MTYRSFTTRTNTFVMLLHPHRRTETGEAVIGLVGKYTDLHDTYLSVVKALLHASLYCKRCLTVKWIDSSALDTSKQHKVSCVPGVKTRRLRKHSNPTKEFKVLWRHDHAQ